MSSLVVSLGNVFFVEKKINSQESVYSRICLFAFVSSNTKLVLQVQVHLVIFELKHMHMSISITSQTMKINHSLMCQPLVLRKDEIRRRQRLL